MTSSPELIHELRASRPSAPAELRARVREIAAEQPARASLGELAVPGPTRDARRGPGRGRSRVRERRRARARPLRRRPPDVPPGCARQGDGGERAPERAADRIGEPRAGSEQNAGLRARPVDRSRAARQCNADGRGVRLRRRLARGPGRARPHPLARGLRRLVLGGDGRGGKRIAHRPRAGRRRCRRRSRGSPGSAGSSPSRSRSTTCRRRSTSSRSARRPYGARSRGSGPGSSRRRSTRRPRRFSAPACRRFAAS